MLGQLEVAIIDQKFVKSTKLQLNVLLFIKTSVIQ